MNTLKNALVTAVLLMVTSLPAQAKTVPDNECEVIVASRQNLDEVRTYLAENDLDTNSVRIYPSQNGWFAIGVAIIDKATANPTLRLWKKQGKIPKDSFCTTGEKFGNVVSLVDKKANQKPLFPQGKCALIIASRQTVADIKTYVSEQQLDAKTVTAYSTDSGWYAIGIDVIDLANAKTILDKRKAQGKIPLDSFCSTGKTYRSAINIDFTKTTPRSASEKPTKPTTTQQVSTPKKSPKKPISIQPKPEFAFIGHTTDGLAAVMKADKWGFIDEKGKVAIALTYDNVGAFENGVAIVEKDGVFSLINVSGQVTTEQPYQRIEPFNGDRAVVKRGGKLGFINRLGEEVIPARYERVGRFERGVATVTENGKKMLIDTAGNVVSDTAFGFIGSFRQGLAPVEQNGRWGFIDHTGKTVINPQFDYADAFSEGFAKIKQNGKYGYIDKGGNVVIAPQFSYAERFQNGTTHVELNGKRQSINTKGEITP